ncbi:MAG: excinuclease ABC subunit C [Calditrichaeota bacterium]|nr:MAG: excinuclease ABC subunit C [Calditrichota bacterium]
MTPELEQKLQQIPRKPGVYIYKDKSGKVIYVGKAKILRNRVRSYFNKGAVDGIKTFRLITRIHDMETIVTDSEMEALILEMNLIKEYKPRYNVNLKDDKSFPYIRVTKEPFPRIFPTRKIVKDGSRYFGPYTDVRQMRGLLKQINKIFPIRSCRFPLNNTTIGQKKYKVCLDYHIKKCDGPCEGLVSQMEYGSMIDQVIHFINGRDNVVVQELTKKMQIFAQKQRYEEAARIRDRVKFIENFQYKQKVIVDDTKDRDVVAVAVEDENACGMIFKIREGKIIGRSHFFLNGIMQDAYADVVSSFLKQYYLKTDFIPKEIYLPTEITEQEAIRQWLCDSARFNVQLTVPQQGEKAKLVSMANKNAKLLLQEMVLRKEKLKDKPPHAVEALKRDLFLDKLPRRIEAFDISNIQGTDPVASMVCFVDGVAKKSDYRNFKIRSGDTPDDFRMMHETITRRYSGSLTKSLPWPDLILIDGGKGQLNAAVQALKEIGKDELTVISLAKRLDEVFMPGETESYYLPRTSSALKLVQRLRDESHRFAITFHRSLRRKRTAVSELEKIAGVGPAKRKALIKFFGSVDDIRQASVDDLALVDGMNRELAKKVWEYFNVTG